MVVAFVFSALLSSVGVRPALAQVTSVRGSAFGYQLLNVSLFNGSPNNVGPVPSVALPAGGAAAPLTASAPTGNAAVSPATFFSSGQIDVSTQGTPASGSVTSSVRIANLNTSQSEVLSASALSSTCTASSSGVTGSTTITGGTLQTDSGDDNPGNNVPDHPASTVTLAANPAPNTSFNGHIHLGDTTDSFTYVLNEQIRNSDGSLTVNAAHQHFLGDIARGDLIIGQSVCGVSGSEAPSTSAPATTTTLAGGTTTTTANATTTLAQATTTTLAATTTVPASTTTTAAGAASGGVSGGAYGYSVTVSLFGGAAASRGPTPTVTLPAAGSAAPVTASAPSGSAQFGPATLFTSDQIDVSTQGTPGGTVTSSATVNNSNKSGQEQLTAATISSTCTASASSQTGSASLKGAKLVTSSGANLDSDADDVVVQLPTDPAANTSYDGKIENVGDTFRVVVNEQVRSAGSITVNAVHMFLLGPTAKGELIIGQSRCSTTSATAAAASTGSAAVGGSAGGSMATTGTEAGRMVGLALFLVIAGWSVTLWARRIRAGRRRPLRPMPWARRTILR
jgi:hypothetical protein